jgi:hypothetical protein
MVTSFQGPFIHSSSGRAARWTLERQSPKVKQVQGDVAEKPGRQRTKARLPNLQHSLFFSGLGLFAAAAGEPDGDQGKLV